MFYKIVHKVVVIRPPENLLHQTDQRTRHSNIYSYKLISTSKDTYKYMYSFYPITISQWNILLVQAQSADTVNAFKTLIPMSILAPIFQSLIQTINIVSISQKTDF